MNRTSDQQRARAAQIADNLEISHGVHADPILMGNATYILIRPGKKVNARLSDLIATVSSALPGQYTIVEATVQPPCIRIEVHP